ncbi:hypothetical protein FV228_13980, partial [Methylobacterium sp. WL18]|uniref:hypothetical protein n=1 Tax=Methylobacterium sp. WL18 TaxID=2603897 RepID=UPI0011D48FD2
MPHGWGIRTGSGRPGGQPRARQGARGAPFGHASPCRRAGFKSCPQASSARGNLTKGLIQRFSLNRHSDHFKYGLGVKELWQLPDSTFE